MPHQDIRETAAPTSRAATVLVVDDDAAWRKLVRDVLEREGFQVVEEGLGDRAMATLELCHADAVVLDDRMPGFRGLDLLPFLRARYAQMPIILMTAFGGPRTEEAARARGANAYLEKPFRMGRLLAELHRVTTSRS